MGHCPKPPPAPDPVLLAATYKRSYGGKRGGDMPSPKRPDDRPADSGIDLVGTAIGAALVYSALSSIDDCSGSE